MLNKPQMECEEAYFSKYGTHTSHIAALSEDLTVKSTDKAKLKGYYRQ